MNKTFKIVKKTASNHKFAVVGFGLAVVAMGVGAGLHEKYDPRMMLHLTRDQASRLQNQGGRVIYQTPRGTFVLTAV